MADQAAVEHITSENRKERGAAAFGGRKGGRRACQTLQPDLAVMSCFGRGAISANKRMRHAPEFPFKLPQSLAKPSGESVVVKSLERKLVFFPKLVSWVEHGSSHFDEMFWSQKPFQAGLSRRQLQAAQSAETTFFHGET